MFHDFPYSHEMNLDYILKLARESMGLHLEIVGDKLQLKNAAGYVISNVTVSYATKALQDANGNDIDAYILSAGVSGSQVIFTNGKGNVTSVTVPYAVIADKDGEGNDITDYIINASVAGDKLRFTKGDDTIFELTVPFATKASTDSNGKDITTYAATIATDGNEVVMRDSMGRELSRITVGYATKALKDNAGNQIDSTYGNALIEGTTTIKLRAANNSVISEITVPYATHAGSAIETVTISGNQIVFTTYNGTSTSITVPYAVKAMRDELNNVIKTTYVANVVNDQNTGKLQFLDAQGNIIVELLPTIDKATHDSLNNTIADYIKTIVANGNSDYVTVAHGTGAVDTITINYANTAWKDTNNNVIKNTYIKRLACVEDTVDHKYKLVAYNGDNPEAELFRIALICDMAYNDVNGRALTSYVGAVEADAVDDTCLDVKDGEGTVVNVVKGEVTPTGSVSVSLTSGTLPSCSYANETITFNPGSFPTVDTATFTGSAADVHFDNDI